MKRATPSLLLASLVLAAGCAQLLSYDDYQARPAADASSGDGSNEAATDAPGDTGPVPIHPPARPAGAAMPSGKGKTIWSAVKHYYFGSTNASGVTLPDAWKDWGYDLDNVCTSVEDSIENIGTCRRPPDAEKDFLQDGNDCRDNSFGQHIVPLFRTYNKDFELNANDGILSGGDTWILRLDDLDDGSDDPYVPGRLYHAATVKPDHPKWDGTDVRQVLDDSVVARDLNQPIMDFPKGYVVGNTWVSGEPEKRFIILPVSGSTFVKLTLSGMRATATIDDAHTTANRGIVVGALPVSGIPDLVDPIATSAGFCPGSVLYETVLKSLLRFPDLVADAPNLQDTNVQCDAISLALAFDGAPIQPVTQVVDTPPPGTNKCSDAGVDAGGD